MSKSRNPGYQKGNNWGICDRCGQAYRQTELVDQHDGLRVCVHDCYDKRHPQEAVRDKGWECGGDGAQGTGLDWNGAGRLARPDVDPLSFIQEPNDAYFTNIPEGTFGQLVPSVYDGSHMDCTTVPDTVRGWWSATDRREFVDSSTFQHLPTDLAYDEQLQRTYSICDAQRSELTTLASGPYWKEDVVTGYDGTNWDSFRFVNSNVTGLEGAQLGTRGILQSDGQPEEDMHETIILVLGNVKYSAGGTTLIRTQNTGNNTNASHVLREGIYVYDTGKIGFKVAYEGLHHPANQSKSDIILCSGTCWTPEAEAQGDLDFYVGDITEDEVFMLTIDFDSNYLSMSKNGDRTTDYFSYNGFSTVTSNYGTLGNGGYVPRQFMMQYASTTPTNGWIQWDLFEAFTLTNFNSTRTPESDKRTVEEYLSWKYNIPIAPA